MELSSTMIDIGIGAVVLISAMFAYSRGLIREISSLGVWILAAIGAIQFYPAIEPIIVDLTAAIGLGSLGALTRWIALGVTFVMCLIVLSFIASFLRKLVSNSLLGGIDKGLGFLFGALRGLLILAIGWIAADYLQPSIFDIEAVNASRGAGLVREAAMAFLQALPPDLPAAIGSIFNDLFGGSDAPPVQGYETPAQSPGTAN